MVDYYAVMQKKTLELATIADIEIIREKIHLIRGCRVMLDSDLAGLYCVPTKRLNEAVRRNLKRFPLDFMFQLDVEEYGFCSRSQFATLNKGRGGNIKYTPFVFTEQGIAMLSSVLRSDRAIEVNIEIMRVFTVLRKAIEDYKDLKDKITDMEKEYGAKFSEIFNVLKFLTAEKNTPREPIGFKYVEKEDDIE